MEMYTINAFQRNLLWGYPIIIMVLLFMVAYDSKKSSKTIRYLCDRLENVTRLSIKKDYTDNTTLSFSSIKEMTMSDDFDMFVFPGSFLYYNSSRYIIGNRYNNITTMNHACIEVNNSTYDDEYAVFNYTVDVSRRITTIDQVKEQIMELSMDNHIMVNSHGVCKLDAYLFIKNIKRIRLRSRVCISNRTSYERCSRIS